MILSQVIPDLSHFSQLTFIWATSDWNPWITFGTNRNWHLFVFLLHANTATSVDFACLHQLVIWHHGEWIYIYTDVLNPQFKIGSNQPDYNSIQINKVKVKYIIIAACTLMQHSCQGLHIKMYEQKGSRLKNTLTSLELLRMLTVWINIIIQEDCCKERLHQSSRTSGKWCDLKYMDMWLMFS